MHLLAYLLLLLPAVACWGGLGHRTVANLAWKHINDETKTWIAPLLGGVEVGKAALWPDETKNDTIFDYSKPWHYINTKETAPTNCTVVFPADCAGVRGCVISALTNQTERLLQPDLYTNLNESIRYVLHFIGDMHQPLHSGGVPKVGGNGINITFDGKTSALVPPLFKFFEPNLHSIWDTSIPNKMRNLTTTNNIKDNDEEARAALSWAQDLFDSTARIEYYDLSAIANLTLGWAQETNKLNCKYTIANGEEALRQADLAGEYYRGAVPIVNSQVKKAGERLAGILNSLAKAVPKSALEVQELK